MKTLAPVALLFFSQVRAQHAPWRRVVGSYNDTATFTNTSSISLIEGPSTPAQPPTLSEPSLSTTEIQPPPTPPTEPVPGPDDSNKPTIIENGPGRPDQSGPTNIPGNGMVDGDNCGSTVTYHGSVYPTVYMTITETFDVTLSAANATMTDSETLITPAQACKSTVVPIAQDGRFTIEETILYTLSDESSTTSSTFSTMTTARNATYSFQDGSTHTDGVANTPGAQPATSRMGQGPNRPTPEDDNGLVPPKITASVVQSTVYSDVPYTSTVIVTKKTPVPVIPRSEPPPDFQPRPSGPQGGDNNRPAPGADPVPDQNSGINSLVQNTQRPVDVITSIIGSLLFPATLTRPAAQTTIANVPIAVRPSSVIIGTSAVPIPVAGSEAVVTQSGIEFVVRPNEIAAPATTIGFGPLSPLQGNAISVVPTRVTAAPGVVVEVGGSTAVVAGTTYRINDNFSTVVTVSGQRISIGPSGIGLPSTTIVPARATNGVIISSVDGITYTLSGSNVIISGTRYGIATDSPTITTEIDGEYISIGPGGIGFPSTTIRPTSAQTKTTSSTSSQPTNSSSGGGDANSAPASAAAISTATLFAAVFGFAILL